ncbi:hypothetical protein, conserved [Babesia ovata]|uniref:6-Cys domain-containing protein n=1 Tax=Babesia ovata TaxID=189622 RepID=A0A2H6KBQ3_9APIC|nr:uncharacterized protein BOVATA_019070 [Babesia ovata]GBE60414.1 hypothetical protein, conserved [Babesia ovata]
MDIDNIGSATVICPSRVNDTAYVWHPRTTSSEQANLKTYVSEGGRFRSVALSDVVVTDAPVAYVSVKSDVKQTTINLDFPMAEIYAVKERRLIFICGPHDLVLSDTMQRHLDRLSVSQPDMLPRSIITPLMREAKKMGAGFGVVFVNIRHLYLPLQGCGSRPSPLFAADNEVTVDPITGTRSCVADPMSKSRIGFLCEGRLEPEDCMRLLVDKNGGMVTAPRPFSYWKFEYHKPWVVAQYFDKLAIPPFNGECKCIDSHTGKVKAKIEIRPKNDYVCDITSKIFRNRLRPINGPWCSVVLHPGSTLTIRFPIVDVDSGPINEDPSLGLLSQQLSIYEFETKFLPKDLNTLRRLASVYDIDTYEEISYNKALAGDALELDASQMARGEVKLKYHLDKPLTSLGGHNSFFFHWTLKSRNKYVFDRIRAAVNVSFAFTHEYEIVGCNRGSKGVFHPAMGRDYCSNKWVENGVGNTYECLYDVIRYGGQAGIYCRPDEVLLPDNCESTGYDLYSNRPISLPASVRKATPYRIRGFQVFDMGFQNNAVSYACVCVNEHGYETSRLILEHNHNETHRYTVRHEDASAPLHPSILMPWSEVGLSREGLRSPEALVLHDTIQNHVTLHVGTTLLLRCGIDMNVWLGYGGNINTNARGDVPKTAWFPKQLKNFYFTVKNTIHGSVLVKTAYNDSIITTPSGLEFHYDVSVTSPGSQIMMITSRKSAILISKDPIYKKIVPITFVCGKAPEPSELPIVTDVASTSSASPPPNIQGLKSSARYTWHVVEVAVETTDPYMQGCGVTYESTDLFKPETPQLYDADGQLQFGCKIDLHMAKEAAFYCPAPYVLDPPNCFSQVSVDGTVKNTRDISQSLVTSQSNHFMILYSFSGLVGPGEKLRQTPPLECRCVTIKGIVLSTIQIENYYAK